MRQHGTLASAIAVVLLSGIVSAGAKTGVLSVEKPATPATAALESADVTTVAGDKGQAGKVRAKGSAPTGSPVSAGAGVTVGGSAPSGGGVDAAGSGRGVTASSGGSLPVATGVTVSGPAATTPSSTAPAAGGSSTPPGFSASALGVPVLGDVLKKVPAGSVLDISKLLNALPASGLPLVGQLLGAVPANQLPLVGSLLTTVGSGDVTQVAGLLKGLPAGGLPVVGQLLKVVPASKLPLLGQLLSGLPANGVAPVTQVLGSLSPTEIVAVGGVLSSLPLQDLPILGELLSTDGGLLGTGGLLSGGGLIGGVLGGVLNAVTNLLHTVGLSSTGIPIVSGLLDSLSTGDLTLVGNLISALPVNQLPILGGVLSGLPTTGLPVVGQLLGAVPAGNLPLVGGLASGRRRGAARPRQRPHRDSGRRAAAGRQRPVRAAARFPARGLQAPLRPACLNRAGPGPRRPARLGAALGVAGEAGAGRGWQRHGLQRQPEDPQVQQCVEDHDGDESAGGDRDPAEVGAEDAGEGHAEPPLVEVGQPEGGPRHDDQRRLTDVGVGPPEGGETETPVEQLLANAGRHRQQREPAPFDRGAGQQGGHRPELDGQSPPGRRAAEAVDGGHGHDDHRQGRDLGRHTEVVSRRPQRREAAVGQQGQQADDRGSQPFEGDAPLVVAQPGRGVATQPLDQTPVAPPAGQGLHEDHPRRQHHGQGGSDGDHSGHGNEVAGADLIRAQGVTTRARSFWS
jgi:hypothetical protein